MKRAAAAIALLALTACVQFTGDELPQRSVDALAKSKVTAVGYTFDASYRGIPTPQNEAYCHVIIGVALKHVFGDTDPAGGSAPLHLDIVMGARPHSAGEEIWNSFTILTAYILPWRSGSDYELQARATWQGKPFKTYQYQDSMSLWIWWPFLPVMITNFPSSKTTAGVMENMVANFVSDLSADVETLPEVAPTAE